jgi:putative FmdB family regulatory protein
MPSYDLVCKSCGNEFELTLHRFIRDEDKVCPQCGSTDVEQVLSAFEWRSTRWIPTKGPILPMRTVAKTRQHKTPSYKPGQEDDEFAEDFEEAELEEDLEVEGDSEAQAAAETDTGTSDE